MKKLAILSMTFLFGVAVTQGQTQKTDNEKVKETKKEQKSERVALRKLEGTTVSEYSKSRFIKDFPGAKNAEWKRVDTYDKVAFVNKLGKSMTAYYDYHQNLVGTTETVNFTDLPAKGQQEINKRYADFKIGQVIFFDDNEFNDTDMILYGIQFDDADNYFVELSKDNKKVVLEVRPDGIVSFFKEI